MTPAVTSSHGIARARRAWSRLAAATFLLGLVLAVLLVRLLPPAPAFSRRLGRATYWQSYETSYFASLRAYEKAISDVLGRGRIPVVVFGDSTIRGAGAAGDEVWTRVLERRLKAVNSRVRVLNYAQNAGDLMGPFLYHHLQRRFPEARYIMQWHFGGQVGARHPFHFWLTSEIALRDGTENPAVRRSFTIVPVTKAEERYAFVLASLNILTNHLDAGNWIRYRWLGRPYFDADRRVKIQPLRDAPEGDVSITRFVPPEQEKTAETLRGIFIANQAARDHYLQRSLEERAAYFADMYPTRLRSHLLLLTLDFNPYYAPHEDAAKMKVWRGMWAQLRADMIRIPDLRWVSLTGSDGRMEVDDYVDLGHLTSRGQRRLGDAVAENLLAPGGWFDPATPGAGRPPARLAGKPID